jgi:epoxyqueuosine reductase
MLIDPEAGSYLFLGVVLTNVDLALDPPFEADRCGSCRLCLDACPTKAFPAERVLDANLCISYLTIEYRGDIDDTLAGKMGDWIFGCDVCQDVCPWNHKFADATDDPQLGRNPGMASLNLAELTRMPESEFGRRFGSTALARPGASGMRRNATIAQRNAGEPAPCPTQS